MDLGGVLENLKRGLSKKHADIRDLRGCVVDLNERSNTLAKYFEQVQWKVQFAGLVPDVQDMVHDILPMSVQKFEGKEIECVLAKLRKGKAPGNDDVPSDFWKILSDNKEAVAELLGLCNHCWEAKDIPDEWRVAKVVLLFKKGDAIFQ